VITLTSRRGEDVRVQQLWLLICPIETDPVVKIMREVNSLKP
jgi:hypothetical protein